MQENNWAMAALGVVLLAVVAAFAAGIIVLCVYMAAFITGDIHKEYRCNQGVVEARDVVFGFGIGTMQPIDGDSGQCH